MEAPCRMLRMFDSENTSVKLCLEKWTQPLVGGTVWEGVGGREPS